MSTWQKLKASNKLWQKFFIREKLIDSVRKFFKDKNFHEVQTPLLHKAIIPESYIEVFTTTLIDRKRNKTNMFLSTSPEISIKKLLAAGIGNCFEITKSFRNLDTGSPLHNPEFTILEWYRVNADYKNIMKDCEDLFIYTFQEIHRLLYKRNIKSPYILSYQEKKIDISSPWIRLSVSEALEKYANITLLSLITDRDRIYPAVNFNPEKIFDIAKKKGYKISYRNSWEEIFNQIFLNEVETHIRKSSTPIIIYDYPKPLAALARCKTNKPYLAERFEVYIAGLEIGDCFSELTDYQEQKKRFESEVKIINKRNLTKVIPDNDFLLALKKGLPKCSGIAVGIDRMMMLFLDTADIKDTFINI